MINKERQNTTVINRTEHNKENPFTTISNQLINDNRLTGIDIGLMTIILNNSDEFIFYSSYYREKTKLGKRVFQTSLDNLKKCGYIIKTPILTGGYNWVINEQPTTQKTIKKTSKPSESIDTDRKSIYGLPEEITQKEQQTPCKPSESIDTDRKSIYGRPINEPLTNNMEFFPTSSNDVRGEKNKPQNQNLEPDSSSSILGKIEQTKTEVKDLFVVYPSSFDYGVNNERENLSPIMEEQKYSPSTKEQKEEQNYLFQIEEPEEEEPQKQPEEEEQFTRNKNEEIKDIISNNRTTNEEIKNSISIQEQPTEIKNRTSNEEINFGSFKREHPTDVQKQNTNEEQKTEHPTDVQKQNIKTEQPETEIKNRTSTEEQDEIKKLDTETLEIICSDIVDYFPNWETKLNLVGPEKFIITNIKYFPVSNPEFKEYVFEYSKRINQSFGGKK